MIKENCTVGQVEDVTVIEFGRGDVGVTSGRNTREGYASLSFNNLEEAKEIGEPIPIGKFDENDNTKVLLKFDNIESIDVVMEGLARVRQNLAEIQTIQLTPGAWYKVMCAGQHYIFRYTGEYYSHGWHRGEWSSRWSIPQEFDPTKWGTEICHIEVLNPEELCGLFSEEVRRRGIVPGGRAMFQYDSLFDILKINNITIYEEGQWFTDVKISKDNRVGVFEEGDRVKITNWGSNASQFNSEGHHRGVYRDEDWADREYTIGRYDTCTFTHSPKVHGAYQLLKEDGSEAGWVYNTALELVEEEFPKYFKIGEFEYAKVSSENDMTTVKTGSETTWKTMSDLDPMITSDIIHSGEEISETEFYERAKEVVELLGETV